MRLILRLTVFWQFVFECQAGVKLTSLTVLKQKLWAGIALITTCIGMPIVSAYAAPGQLLEATPITGAPSGARAWRIRYETRSKDGLRIESTGILVAPVGAPLVSNRDVVAWAHGTTGISRSCAPSLSKKALSGIPALAEMITKGWTVVASDYPGLGTAGPHAYLVGDEAAYALLDSVRAAKALPAAGAGSNFVVWGHSQGGHAALFTGQQAKHYAPELRLAGVVAAAPPTDLTVNLQNMSPMIRGVLTALTAQSWSQVYGADLSAVADKTTRGVIRRTAATCDGEAGIAGLVRAIRLRDRLGHVDLTSKEPWHGLLAQNSANVPEAGASLLVIQGDADPLISAKVTRDYVKSGCKNGARVRLMEVGSKDHAGIAIATAGEAVRWIADRFAGRLAPDSC